MGRAKRLRKARMARRICLDWLSSPEGVANYTTPLGDNFIASLRKDMRRVRLRHDTYSGRNPKVLAKRRRQRERLATLSAVREVAMDVWKCSDGTFALLSDDALREATELQRVYAEQLHAIAEGP